LHLARIYLEASAPAPARYHCRVTCPPPHSLPPRLSPFILFSIASHLGPPTLAKQRATGHARVSDARRFIPPRSSLSRILHFLERGMKPEKSGLPSPGARALFFLLSGFRFSGRTRGLHSRMDDAAIPRLLRQIASDDGRETVETVSTSYV